MKKSHEVSLNVEEGGKRVKGTSRIQDLMERGGRGALSRMEREIHTEDRRKITGRVPGKDTESHYQLLTKINI